MKRTCVYIIALVCCLCAGTPWSFAQTFIENYQLTEPAFSPDGDSFQDTTGVTFTLGTEVQSVSVIVFQDDSVSVVDTLIAPAAFTAGSFTAGWDGKAWDGTAVPEGLYLVRLAAAGGAATDTASTLPVAVDTTPPAISVLGAEPGLYAPGLVGTPQVYTVTIVISNSSPAFGLPHLVDELAYDVTDPVGAAVTPDNDRFDPEYAGTDGTYAYEWDASLARAVDGIYRMDFVVADKAGHSARATHYANFDVDRPDVEPINVTDGDKLSRAPDSLYGWAWDRSGIDSLYARYAAGSSFYPLEFVPGLDDTVYFGFPLADSLSGDGEYKITVRAKDAVAPDTGRVTKRGITFTLDTTAPDAPTVEPFDGTWRSAFFPLEARWTGSPFVIRIYRNGEKVDSVFVVLNDSFERDVALAPGQNILTVTSVDLASNESAPSNAARVFYDQQSGLFAPAPFRPGDRFNVNLARDAAGITLRVYDLAGDIVVKLTGAGTGRDFSFVWDGLNGDGKITKKGPLVAVADVRYADGGRDTFREIFLFDPGG